jgi:hypothetical protein
VVKPSGNVSKSPQFMGGPQRVQGPLWRVLGGRGRSERCPLVRANRVNGSSLHRDARRPEAASATGVSRPRGTARAHEPDPVPWTLGQAMRLRA